MYLAFHVRQERMRLYLLDVFFLLLVGYMVGLGDRHVQNILIDTNTAEFIHIDLGECLKCGVAK
jgi:ataxia telangiectasia mutated family protein